MRTAVVAGWMGVLCAASCTDRTLAVAIPHQDRVALARIPATGNRDIDILFVIDDSPSMADKQQNLRANFTNFIDVLRRIEGGLPNLHIGVVSPDLGTMGTNDTLPGPSISGPGGCSGRGKQGELQTRHTPFVTGAFISDVQNSEGTRSRNYVGSLEDAFSAIAQVGDSGCGFEQPLEAAKRALDGNPANAGFLRSDAYLVIIFVTDEDDCSLSTSALLAQTTATLGPRDSFRCTRFGITCDEGGADSRAMNQIGPKRSCHPDNRSPYLTHIDDYVAFFRSLKPDNPSRVVVAGIMGTPEPLAVELRASPLMTGEGPIPALAHSCSYIDSANRMEVADPPIRLQQFLDAFPYHSTFASICQPDLSEGLTRIGELLTSTLPSWCIEGTLADVDPNAVGPQYDCSVSDITNFGKPNQVETLLPPCDAPGSPETAANKPCWTIAIDRMGQCEAQRLMLHIERAQAPAPGSHTVSYCATCDDADHDGICDL